MQPPNWSHVPVSVHKISGNATQQYMLREDATVHKQEKVSVSHFRHHFQISLLAELSLRSQQPLLWFIVGAQWKFSNTTPPTDEFWLQCGFSLQDITGPQTCYPLLRVICSTETAHNCRGLWIEREHNADSFHHASWISGLISMGDKCLYVSGKPVK